MEIRASLPQIEAQFKSAEALFKAAGINAHNYNGFIGQLVTELQDINNEPAAYKLALMSSEIDNFLNEQFPVYPELRTLVKKRFTQSAKPPVNEVLSTFGIIGRTRASYYEAVTNLCFVSRMAEDIALEASRIKEVEFEYAD